MPSPLSFEEDRIYLFFCPFDDLSLLLFRFDLALHLSFPASSSPLGQDLNTMEKKGMEGGEIKKFLVAISAKRGRCFSPFGQLLRNI